MPTGPDGSGKIVLAAGALQHLLPTPVRPPLSSGFRKSDRMLIPGIFHMNDSLGHWVPLFIAVAISPALYGLLHFLAWSGQFPTPQERLIWRISSIVVTCSGLVETVVGSLLTWWRDRYRNSDPTFRKLIAVICGTIIPLPHILASGFLFVESVRQLLFLDDAAYRLPAWSNYWSHPS